MSLYDCEMTDQEILDYKPFRWKHMCMDLDLIKIKPKKAHRIPIVWDDVKFLKKNKKSIPKKQGIYMFVLDISNKLDLNTTSKYVLYVGQTKNLRTRFGTYFGYIKSDIPADFLKKCMILIWKKKLDFHFFQTSNLSGIDLTKVEFDLIDTLVPPINQRFRGKILKKRIKLYSPR